jgi:hypothetical protein
MRDPAENEKSTAQILAEDLAKRLTTNARAQGACSVVVMVNLPNVEAGPDNAAFYCAYSGNAAECLGLSEIAHSILLQSTVPGGATTATLPTWKPGVMTEVAIDKEGTKP